MLNKVCASDLRVVSDQISLVVSLVEQISAKLTHNGSPFLPIFCYYYKMQTNSAEEFLLPFF